MEPGGRRRGVGAPGHRRRPDAGQGLAPPLVLRHPPRRSRQMSMQDSGMPPAGRKVPPWNAAVCLGKELRSLYSLAHNYQAPILTPGVVKFLERINQQIEVLLARHPSHVQQQCCIGAGANALQQSGN